MGEYKIVTMPFSEVETAVQWAAAEGWNPGLNDARCLYTIDPGGFFMGVLDGVPIARAALLNYDDQFSFGGLYIVAPDHRGQGYGMTLVEAMLSHAGDRIIAIDGVVAMQEKYKLLMGFQFAHRDIRHQFQPNGMRPMADGVVPAAGVAFADLAAYDRRHFPAPREAFLKCWIAQDNAVALVFVQDGAIQGFGVLRRCLEGAKIGPLFADNPEIAASLFDALANHAGAGPVFLDIPEPNEAALALADANKMTPVFECARMYRRGDPGLPLAQIYGMTTLEAG